MGEPSAPEIRASALDGRRKRLWLVMLPLIAAAALGVVYRADRILWRHTRMDRFSSEEKSAKATVDLVTRRLKDIDAYLEATREVAELRETTGGQRPPAQASRPFVTHLTPGETRQLRAALVAEQVALQRQRTESEVRQEGASRALQNLRPQGDSGDTSELLFRLLDRSTYLHAVFHMSTVGTVVFAFVAVAGALLLLLGNVLSLEIRAIFDFLKQHVKQPGTGAAIAPFIATLAGAGAIAVGVAGATLATPAAGPHLDDVDVHSGAVSARSPDVHKDLTRPDPPPPIDPIYLALAMQVVLEGADRVTLMQPVIERSERTSVEIRDAVRQIATNIARVDSKPHVVRLDGNLQVAGYPEAVEQLASLQARSNDELHAISAHASRIETDAKESAQRLARLDDAMANVASNLGELKQATGEVETETGRGSDASECLVKWEHAKASRWFGARLLDAFTGGQALDCAEQSRKKRKKAVGDTRN